MDQVQELARRIFGITRAEQAARAWKNALWLLIGLGGILLFIWSSQQPEPQAAFGGGALVAAASATVGAFTGLLFGLPRSAPKVETGRASSKPAADEAAAGSARAVVEPIVVPNSNLIEISDWTTKIIVGLGLTQLGSLPGDFQRLVDFARGAVGGDPSASGVVGALIVTYTGAAFILSYLASRTDLECAMAAVDPSARGQLDLLSQLNRLKVEGAVTDDQIAEARRRILENIAREIP
jgi:hypothetical protein